MPSPSSGTMSNDSRTYSFVYGTPNSAKDGVDGTQIARSQSSGNGTSAAALKDKTVTYEMSFPWRYFGAGASIKTGHSLAVNFQFYLADGTTSSEYFENSTYLGSVYYGSKDGDNKAQYPVVKLIAEKNPPKVTATSTPVSSSEPESSKQNTATVPDAVSSENTASETVNSSDTVTDVSQNESVADDSSEDDGFPLWAIIVIAVVGVAAVAAVTVVVIGKKK